MQHSIWKMSSTIKNGLLARKKSVKHPSKSLCKQVLKTLYKEGYINGFRNVPGNLTMIEILLKYNSGKPAISKLYAVSKPGRRVYVSVSSLWKLSTSLQTLIISTPRGVLSDKECRQKHLGGELLFVIQ